MKKIVSRILLLCLFLQLFSLCACNAKPEFEYEVVAGHAIITGYNGDGGDILIPSDLGGYSVYGVGYGVFRGNLTITSVYLSEGIQKLGREAFFQCNEMKSIHIPSTLVFEDDYFGFTSKKLEKITVADNHPLYKVAGNCLLDKSNVLLRGCLTSVIPDYVTEIGDGAFERLDITSFVIPEHIQTIGTSLFYFCEELTSVTLPKHLTAIPAGMFGGCTKLETVTLPDGVTLIGDGAFAYCDMLKSVTLPDGVTRLGERAFFNCPTLLSINFPDGLEFIGPNAFRACNNLTHLEIPSGVTEIGEEAFAWCDRLAVIRCGAEKQPSTWNENWAYCCSAKIVWNYTNQ
ncbi:MAG: leucine-rich repeat domain-containing protein [Clostridia bacterium]|nr:leucine-rich repeat domain-containing protein [Clostridia bacterium]